MRETAFALLDWCLDPNAAGCHILTAGRAPGSALGVTLGENDGGERAIEFVDGGVRRIEKARA
jgi:hypothetical protein